MGATACELPTKFFSLNPVMAIFAAVMWCAIGYIAYTTGGNISFQNNLHCKVVRCAAGVSSAPAPNHGFFVDSGASDHICHDRNMFSTLDLSVNKVFLVVHGDNVSASGVGTVELLVQTS